MKRYASLLLCSAILLGSCSQKLQPDATQKQAQDHYIKKITRGKVPPKELTLMQMSAFFGLVFVYSMTKAD